MNNDINTNIQYDLETDLEFTSGDIYEKLNNALKAMEIDPSYQQEADVLREAVPNIIPLEQIIIKLGASWIPVKYYEQFCKEVLEIDARIFYCNLTHTWDLRCDNFNRIANWNWGWSIEDYEHDYHKVKQYPAVGSKMSAGLFTLALNQTVPEVRVAVEKGDSPETEPNFTRQAIARQNQLKRRFEAWCREDSQRAEALEEIYNTKINRLVLMNWDGLGVKHLHPGRTDTLKATGMSELWLRRLRDYQLDAVWRFSRHGGLIALEVGLGKTAVACATVMLRKYYQTCTKALIVVQKATLNQFYNTMLEMYPKSKVLCAEAGDMSADNRQNFLAQIAYNNWDAVIMTHDSFERIDVRRDTELSYINKSLKSVRRQITKFEMAGESKITVGKTRGSEILKKLDRVKATLQKRFDELAESKDRGICWENLGIDYLIVDEAQRFKNNMVETSLTRKISGLSIRPSGRAKDFDLKSYWLRSQHGQHALVGMTGTPEPTNSVLGIYVFQSYFQPEELIKRDIVNFDAWVSNFGEIKSQPEPKINGKWAITERLTDFINVPELLTMWLSCVHYKRYEDVVADFSDRDKRPEAEFITINNKMSPFQTEGMAEIATRYDRLKNQDPMIFPSTDKDGCLLEQSGDKLYDPITKNPLKVEDLARAIELELDIEARVDNFLLLSGDSRKLMIAPQLIDPNLPVNAESKLIAIADNVLRIHEQTKAERATQAIFLDLGTPGGNARFCLYEWLRDYWIHRGVAAEEIAFIQDYKKPEAKEELFERVNRGEVRLFLSSSESGGIGVNIQERLRAIHHCDFPYRPDILEQRQGRGVRFGNRNSVVEIYRYITEGSKGTHGADTVILQFLQNKQQLRDRFMNGDPTLRRLSENDSAAELYMMLKAESTGDERIVRYTEVEVELEEKAAELALSQAELARINGNKTGSIINLEKLIELYETDALRYTAEIDRVSPYIKYPQDEVISYCFEDGTLIIGHRELEALKAQPEAIELDWQERYPWAKKLAALYLGYHPEITLYLLSYRQAQIRIGKRLVGEMLEQDYEIEFLDYSSGSARIPGISNRSINQVFEAGNYKGLTLFFSPFGNKSFSVWLAGSKEWRIVFRSTPDLMLEQLENAIAQVLHSRVKNEKYLLDFTSRLKKIKLRKVEVEKQVNELQIVVQDLEQEKSELQTVLDIE